jgi:zinc resistance-associated protein
MMEIGMLTLRTVAVSSFLALGTVAATAQTPSPPTAPAPQQTEPQQTGPRREREPLSRAAIDSLTDARIAGIQAGLKLNAEQQRLWPPVEQALRAIASDRADRMEARRGQASQSQPDLMQRLERRAELSTRNAQRVTALATAVKPLWAALDDNQKRLLPVLMRQGDWLGGRSRYAMQRGGRHEHRGMPDGRQSPRP